MLKKILLGTAIAGMLSSTIYAAEGDFTVKLGPGVSFLTKQDLQKKESATDKVEMKNDGVSFSIAGGVQYSFLDNIRAGLEVTHLFNPKLKATLANDSLKTKLSLVEGTFTTPVNANHTVKGGSLNTTDGALSTKYNATSFVADVEFVANVAEMVNLYVGGGAGIGHVSAKVTETGTVKYTEEKVGATTETKDISYKVSTETKFKSKTGFAWKVKVGGEVEVTDGVFLGLEGAYSHFGKTGKNEATTTLSVNDSAGKDIKGEGNGKAIADKVTALKNADKYKALDLSGFTVSALFKAIF